MERGDHEGRVVAVQRHFGVVAAGAEHGIGLVRQREDHVGRFPAHFAEHLHKRQPVEQVAAVDHQRHGRDGRQRRRRGEQRHQRELHRSRVDQQAHHRRPRPAQPGVDQQDAKRRAEEDVAQQHGDGFSEGVEKQLSLVHEREQSFPEGIESRRKSGTFAEQASHSRPAAGLKGNPPRHSGESPGRAFAKRRRGNPFPTAFGRSLGTRRRFEGESFSPAVE